MEAIALNLASEAAVPAGTYVYETLKNQTGRAKFEKGKMNLQGGFAVLRDDKAGGLLPARERVELLQTHAQLVANRKDVEEITNTFYGSLAHRNTAKEFKSKAKQFRKDVEIPAEKAQMEYELRKAELEMAAEIKPVSKISDMRDSAEHNSSTSAAQMRSKPATTLTRSPTIMDYPVSSQSRPAPARPMQNQRTWSAPVQQVDSAPRAPGAVPAGGVNHNLRQSRSRNALADTPSRPPPLANSKSLPGEGKPNHDSRFPETANAYDTAPQRFQTVLPHPPTHRPNQSQKNVHPAVQSQPGPGIEPSDGVQHRPLARTGNLPNRGKSPNRARPPPLRESFKHDAEQASSYNTGPRMAKEAHAMHARQPPAVQQNQTMAPALNRYTSRPELHSAYSAPQARVNDGPPHPVRPNLQNSGQHSAPEPLGEPLARPVAPIHWNIDQPCEPTGIASYNDIPLSNTCTCFQSRYATEVPCSNCRNAQRIQPPPQSSFNRAYPTSQQQPNYYSPPNVSQHNPNNQNNWGSPSYYSGPPPERGPAIQLEVRVQYSHADYPRHGPIQLVCSVP